MKKKVLVIFIILLSLLTSIFIFKSEDNNEIVYKTEFVTSISEIDNSLPTIIMFKLPACDDCIKMEVIYKNLYEKHSGKFNLVYYDASEFTNIEIQNAINRYQVVGAPTSIVMNKNRTVIAKIEGIEKIEKIEELLKEAGM